MKLRGSTSLSCEVIMVRLAAICATETGLRRPSLVAVHNNKCGLKGVEGH